MSGGRIATLLLSGPKVVATVHSPAGLRAATALARGAVDLLEIRVDGFIKHQPLLLAALPSLAFPLIITVRHPAEGGARAMPDSRRIELFEAFLPYAAMIDVELRSLAALGPVLPLARAANVGLIVSHHDFRDTPPRARLRALAGRALKAKADILKVAAFTETPRHLSRLLEFAATETRVPLSVMGMGPLGKISRLLFSQAGSVLNYGFLDKSQVSGQWPAVQLKERIAEL